MKIIKLMNMISCKLISGAEIKTWSVSVSVSVKSKVIMYS